MRVCAHAKLLYICVCVYSQWRSLWWYQKQRGGAMGNKRGKRRQQQQQVLGSSSTSAAAAAVSSSPSSSSRNCAYIQLPHRSNGDDVGDGEEGGRSAASGKGKGKGKEEEEVGGVGCRHVGRGVNLEKLQEKLRKIELVQCHECHKADDSSPGDGAREKRGKTKKVGKKKAQLNGSKNGVGVGAADRRERSAIVCLACAHIGCAASGRNKEVQEEEDEEEGGEELELGVGLGHARQHFLQWKHPLALHRGENLTVWCFQCNSTIRVDHSATSPAEESADNSSATSRVALLQQAMKLVHDKLVSPVQVTEQSWQIERQILSIESDTLSSQEQRKEKWMIRGLVNLGNTCFFNSVMQNLLALDLLRNHFCKAEYNREGFLTSALRRFYRDFYAGSNEATKDYNYGEANGKSNRNKSSSDSSIGCTLSPKILFGAICARSSRFKGYQQQDSHELLRCLLDGLHIEEQTELSKAGHRHAGSANSSSTTSECGHAESRAEPEEKSSKDCSVKSLNSAETFVEQMFGGQYSSTVSCCECSHSSVVYEPFLDLSLPLPTKSAFKKSLPSKGSSSQIKLSSLSARSGRPHVSKESKRRITSMACNSEASKTTESGRKLPTSSESGNESAPLAEKEPASITGGVSSCPQSNDLVEDFTWIDYIGEEEYAQANLTEGSPNGPSDCVAITSADGAPELIPFINSELNLLDQQALQNSTASESGVIAASSIFPARVGSDHFEDCEKLLEVAAPDVILLPFWSSDRITTGLPSNEERDPFDSCTIKIPSLQGMVDKCSKNSTVSCSGYSDAGTDFEGFSELFEENTSYECVSLAFDHEKDTEAGVGGPKQSIVKVNIAQGESGDLGGHSKDDIQKGQPRETQIGKVVESMSLEKCLENFTASELLSGENAWGCDYCSRMHSVAVTSTSSRRSTEVSHNSQNVVLKSQSVGMPPVSEKGEAAAAAICMTGFETDAAPGVVCEVRKFSDKTTQAICSDSCNGSSHSASPLQLNDGCMPCDILKGSLNGNQNFEKHEAGVCRGNEAEPESVELVGQLAFEEQLLLERKSTLPESSKRGYDMVASCCDGLGKVDNQALLLTNELNVMTEIDANEGVHQRTSRLDWFEKDAIKSEKHLLFPEAKENRFILERETEVLHEAESKLCVSSRSESSCSSTKSSKGGLKSRKSQTDKAKAEAERIVKQNALKRLLISKAPPILTVHLKRFAQDNHGRLNKLYGHIAFSEWLDLHPFLDSRCSNSESWIYRLVGIVEHIGNMKGGHYVAYVRGNADATEVPDMRKAESFQVNFWYYISDSHVIRTTIESVLRSEAYLLFYERIYCRS
ncbi:hypothetical protein O6H91_02G127900 [Diphasiastrum complanatum]|uniref:Uncharacterized protein n=1 Tax=Diphasiastrum complanatum TaxID=34168 RepID=A0ACC2EKI0_DIPCM|nr:hypothetical protein O6H91_02G127900 [Diphasiastrum complanatum]